MATPNRANNPARSETGEEHSCSTTSSDKYQQYEGECNKDEDDLSLSDEDEDHNDNDEQKEAAINDPGTATDMADIFKIKHHPSYTQVMLDVNRCAGRLAHIRQCYLHRTDEDEEPPEDLTEDLRQLSSDDDEEITSATSVGSNSITSTTPVPTPKTTTRHRQSSSISGGGGSSNKKDDEANAEKLERIAKDLQYQRRLKKKLAKLIVRLLLRKPGLHYYQGFHDVCLTYMTIYGELEAFKRLDKLIDSHFSAFMQPTMNETQEFLALIPIIVSLHDSRVAKYLEQAEVGTIYALSWVITWFSHVIPNERDVETIFTRLESIDDPHLILYLCAEIVLYKSRELLELEPEMSAVHHYLCQVPRKEKLPIEELLDRAAESKETWPPELVKQRLSRYRREKLQVHNYNLVQSFAQRFVPALTSLVTSPGSRRTALVVFVVASALALQFDRWIR